MAGNNLKTNITADTSQFNKQMKGAKAALRDFEKEGSSALSGITSMFGVSSGAIEGVVKNLGQAVNASKLLGSTGEGATRAVTAGMKALGASIAGLGIMAAVAAFRELNAQAANFEQRLQGVNLAASANAYRQTFRQSLYDTTGTGEKWAKFWEGAKTAASNAWAVTVSDVTISDIREAKTAAERAGQLASQMVDPKREERALSTEIQGINNKILEEQNKFRNTSITIAERKQAEATIAELLNEKYAKQEDLQGRMLANVRERNSLTTSTEAELDEEANLERGILALQGQHQQELNAMLRTHNSINKAVSQTATSAKETQEATALTLEAATKLVEKERQLAEINRQNAAAMAGARLRMDGALAVPGASSSLQGQAQRLTMPAIIKPQIDTEAAQAAIIELSGIVESGVQGMSEALGDLVGNLINGENAWGSFAQAGISVVADMVSMLGQAFIKTGLGVIAADLAIKTGNGYAAVAAGAAMVAIAAAMKTSMSNAAANWGGGYSAPVASSAYTPGTSLGTYGREMEIKVTGTLTAEGSKLKAVLNNEDYRTNITT